MSSAQVLAPEDLEVLPDEVFSLAAAGGAVLTAPMKQALNPDLLRLIDRDHPDGAPHELRHCTALALIRRTRATSVLDIGCGEGQLIAALHAEAQIRKILGVDNDPVEIERAKRLLAAAAVELTPRVELLLADPLSPAFDTRLDGYEFVVVAEVIEHLDLAAADALLDRVLSVIRPRWALVTTPNRDYNPARGDLTAHGFRHPDHRFEFSREEFAAWSHRITRRSPYTPHVIPIGIPHPALGPRAQGVVLQRS